MERLLEYERQHVRQRPRHRSDIKSKAKAEEAPKSAAGAPVSSSVTSKISSEDSILRLLATRPRDVRLATMASQQVSTPAQEETGSSVDDVQIVLSLPPQVEKENKHGKPVNLDDVFKKMPIMEKLLKEEEKKELLKMLEKKTEEEVFRRQAYKTSQDHAKMIDRGSKNIEMSWQHVKELKDKDEVIKGLTKKIEEERKATNEKSFELRNQRNAYAELKAKYDKIVAVQGKYSQANENVIRRLQEQQVFADKLFKSVNARLKEHFTGEPDLSEREKVATDKHMAEFRENFERLMRKMNDLEDIKEQWQKLRDERENMMAYFGLSTDKSRTLWQAFRDHIIKMDDKIGDQRKEIVALNFKLNLKKMQLKRTTEHATLQKQDSSLQMSAESNSWNQELMELNEAKEKAEKLADHLETKVSLRDLRIKELEKMLEQSKVSLDKTRGEMEMEKLKMSLMMDAPKLQPEPESETLESEEENDLMDAYSAALQKKDDLEAVTRPVSREPKDLANKKVIPPINSEARATEVDAQEVADLNLSKSLSRSSRRKVRSRNTSGLATFHDRERLSTTDDPLGVSMTVTKLAA